MFPPCGLKQLHVFFGRCCAFRCLCNAASTDSSWAHMEGEVRPHPLCALAPAFSPHKYLEGMNQDVSNHFHSRNLVCAGVNNSRWRCGHNILILLTPPPHKRYSEVFSIRGLLFLGRFATRGRGLLKISMTE